MPSSGDSGIRFDITDEPALRYIQRYACEQIHDLDAETRRGIVQLLDYQFRHGVSPQATARAISNLIGLTPDQEQIAQNYESTLRAAIRGEATWDDVKAYRLNPIRGPGGLVENRIDIAVARYRQRMIASRAETIVRTETMRAVHAGQRERWRQLDERGALPITARRKWMTAEDERVCTTCGPLNGHMTPLNEAYPGGFDGPPAHPRCRCTEVLTGL